MKKLIAHASLFILSGCSSTGINPLARDGEVWDITGCATVHQRGYMWGLCYPEELESGVPLTVEEKVELGYLNKRPPKQVDKEKQVQQ